MQFIIFNPIKKRLKIQQSVHYLMSSIQIIAQKMYHNAFGLIDVANYAANKKSTSPIF